jgi:hypothetical protein
MLHRYEDYRVLGCDFVKSGRDVHMQQHFGGTNCLFYLHGIRA